MRGHAAGHGTGLAACALGAVLLVAGCSGGPGGMTDAGASGGGPDVRDVRPGVHVAFPPAASATDQDTLRVRGTAVLADGVAAIRVNGVEATSDNGFLDWQATVPLARGVNVLAIASEDGRGIVDPAAAEVSVTRSAQPLSNPRFIGVDQGGKRLLVLEHFDTVTAVDLDTGERRSLFALPAINTPYGYRWHAPVLDAARERMLVLLDREGGPALLYSVDLVTGQAQVRFEGSSVVPPAQPLAMALDAAGERVFLGLEAQVARVALDTGAFELVSSVDLGGGPLTATPAVMRWDAARERLLIAATDHDMLLAVDPDTGDRTVVSDASLVASLALTDAVGMTVDAQSGQVLVVRGTRDTVLAVDPATGERQLIEPGWADLRPAGQGLGDVVVVAGDEASGRRLLIADDVLDAVLGLAPDTGQIEVVSALRAGAGTALLAPAGLVLDAKARQGLIVDRGRAQLVGLDLDTGERAVRASLWGGAEQPDTIASMALDAARGRMLLVDADGGALLAVDLDTGDRMDLDLDDSDSGVLIYEPRAVVVDAARGRALVADAVETSGAAQPARYNQIVAVDLDTGQRSVAGILLSRSSVQRPRVRALALDPRGGRALLVDAAEGRASLWAMDLETGWMSLVSGRVEGQERGGGVPFDAPRALFVDARGERALVLDGRRLLAVELATGQRTVVASDMVGKGPLPSTARSAQWGILDGTEGRALVLGEGGSVIGVDLMTGERVFFSR